MLAEYLKQIKDITQPLMLVAFFGVLILGIVNLILNAPRFWRMVIALPSSTIADLLAQVITCAFWLALWLLIFGFFTQAYLAVHKANQPAPLPDLVHPPLPESVNVAPQAPPRPHEYKLVWFNHFDQRLWDVKRTYPQNSEVRNDEFKSWCQPFDESTYIVFQRRLIAGDEVFKEPANWWTAPPYNLPPLNPRWLHIMDDEKWYFYEVEPK